MEIPAQARKAAWKDAVELIDPIIEKHGLTQHSIGIPFSTSVMTKVDQNIEHVMRVANWLLGGDE